MRTIMRKMLRCHGKRGCISTGDRIIFPSILSRESHIHWWICAEPILRCQINNFSSRSLVFLLLVTINDSTVTTRLLNIGQVFWIIFPKLNNHYFWLCPLVFHSCPAIHYAHLLHNLNFRLLFYLSSMLHTGNNNNQDSCSELGNRRINYNLVYWLHQRPRELARTVILTLKLCIYVAFSTDHTVTSRPLFGWSLKCTRLLISLRVVRQMSVTKSKLHL